MKDIKTINAAMDLNGLMINGLECYSDSEHEERSVARTRINICGDNYERIRNFSARHQIKLDSIVLYAWHYALHIYSGADETVIGIADAVLPPVLAAQSTPNPLVVSNHKTGVTVGHALEQLRLLERPETIQQFGGCGDVGFKSIAFRLISEKCNSQLNNHLRSDDSALILAYTIQHDSIKLEILHHKGRYAANRIAEFAHMYGHIIATLAAANVEANENLELCLIPPQLIESALGDNNRTDRRYSTNITLHGLFERQVEITPDAIAVVDDIESISYRQLELRSNALAHRLLANGFEQATVVGVALRKSVRMAIALYGVLKVGGIYMPFPASYSRQRLDAMLVDGLPPFMIADAFIDDWNPTYQGKVIRIDSCSENEEGMRVSTTPPATEIDAGTVAYIIYTSGSTGEPKGVMITHRAVANTLQDINAIFEISSGDRALLISNIGFDLSVYDIFGLLSVGGTVVMPNEDEEAKPEYLVNIIRKNSITLWSSTPQLMDRFIGGLHPKGPVEGLHSLRQVFLSGEWIPLALPDRIREALHNPSLHIVGLGGATEASIWSVYFRIESKCDNWRSIPYGRPLGNQTIYILDRDCKPLPPGAVGELYIGGIGVSVGYFRQSGLSDEKFRRLSVKVSEDETFELGNLYRTGDIGRYLADGNIEFLGRVGTTIVIDGRIACPGIVESIITREISGINQCVVLSKKGNPSSLVCFYVSDSELDEQSAALLLQSRIPHQHVPQSYIRVGEIPLSRNGKLERGSLLKLL